MKKPTIKKPTKKEIHDNMLVVAFLQGAKYWEYITTGGTMWQSDGFKCVAEAERRLQNKTLGVDIK